MNHLQSERDVFEQIAESFLARFRSGERQWVEGARAVMVRRKPQPAIYPVQSLLERWILVARVAIFQSLIKRARHEIPLNRFVP